MTDRVIWVGNMSVIVMHPLDPTKNIDTQVRGIVQGLNARSLSLIASRASSDIEVGCFLTNVVFGTSSQMYYCCVAGAESDIWRLRIDKDAVIHACATVMYQGVIAMPEDSSEIFFEIPIKKLFETGLQMLPNWMSLAVRFSQDDKEVSDCQIRVPMMVFK